MGLTPSAISTCNPNLAREEQCGGHGRCDPTTLQCTCDDLWSKSTDFISPYEECALSTVGIRILWLASIIEIIAILYQILAIVIIRVEAFLEERKKRKGYTLWKNKGLLSLLVFMTLSMPSQFIMAILHLVDPETRIGFDAFPTVLFFTGKLGLYIAGKSYDIIIQQKKKKNFQLTLH
jgi:hypothetical protein